MPECLYIPAYIYRSGLYIPAYAAYINIYLSSNCFSSPL